MLLAAEQYTRQIPDNDKFFAPWKHTLDAGLTLVQLTEAIALEPPDNYINLRLNSLDAFRPLDTRAPDPQIAEGMRWAFFGQMERWLEEGYRLHILCSTDGERQRFEELWREGRKPLPASIGFLSRGFLWPDTKLAVITDSEIFGRYKPARPRQKLHAVSSPISDWTELEPGDYVVHIQHGIGKYLGLKPLEVSGTRQEVLAIEYANEARLYVPVDQAHLVSKYIGAGKRVPKLHELGGTLWQKQKFTAERAIIDLAERVARNPPRATSKVMRSHRYTVATRI